ncbi:hypothetical protein AUJ84_04075 [Candidatus Pacearchaeota archaeon CG1_02_32_132]|nr:MAG: hypothetical protein AUJ84_04075 [Candidatus Pacearchaeota archaeon CG1_02_32_132]
MKFSQSLKIGNVLVKNRLFLSPMVDVTDLAFRLLCRKQGAGMAYTEMIYIDAILHENSKTKSLMKTCKEDKPLGLQVTGNSIEEFKKFAKLDLLHGYGLIDINCGCPSIRITGNQAGSYLLKSPEKIGEMIKTLKDRDLTVTAKIRLGFNKNNSLEVVKEIEKAGADLITVHTRLANQGASVPADGKWISKIKDRIGIPLIANGDIFSGKDVEKYLDLCDGVMIARGAIGNPFIFRGIERYFKTGSEKEIGKGEKISAFRDYLKLAEKHEVVDLGRVKHLGGSFLKGFDGAAKIRQKLMQKKNFEDILEFIESFK